MDAQSAFNTLFNEVHAPVFFAKLAQDYGIHPQSQEEASKMLHVAGKLRNVYVADQVKQASTRVSALDTLDSKLDSLLGNTHGDNSSSAVKQAAVNALQQDKIREAAGAFVQHMLANQ